MVQKRDISIDILKGFLVLQMVLCHCIQFFGNESKTLQHHLCDYINLTTFSGFMFAFGFSCYYAYFSKEFKDSAIRISKTAVKSLICFYISSICYVGLVEFEYFDPRVFGKILLLQKYAGWSEFLASFFGIMILALVLFRVFQKMNIKTLAIIGVLSVGMTFLPYGKIHNSWLALLVGSGDYITFPICQYLIYFAAGVYLCKYKPDKKYIVFLIAVLASLPEMVYYLKHDCLTERFPPDFAFVLGAAVVIYAYYFLAYVISVKASGRVGNILKKFFSQIGQNTMFYLICSNVVIFAFSASKFKLRTFDYVIKFYLLLMLAMWFVQHLIRNKQFS